MKLDLAAQEIKNSYPAASDFYFFPASSDFFVDAYGYEAQILIKLPCWWGREEIVTTLSVVVEHPDIIQLQILLTNHYPSLWSCWQKN